jgi:hypothetical protein
VAQTGEEKELFFSNSSLSNFCCASKFFRLPYPTNFGWLGISKSKKYPIKPI